jgi:hypothetical protein
MLRSMFAPAILTGRLRYLALIFAGIAIALGAQLIAYPSSAASNLGVPIHVSNASAKAFIAAAGLRDTAIGIVLLIFALVGDRRAVGIVGIAGVIVAGGDGVIFLKYGEGDNSPLIGHWGPAVVYAALSYVYLLGEKVRGSKAE